MALTYSLNEELGKVAPDFELPATDGKTYSLEDFRDAKALVVIFMCNHCPYVVAVQDRINQLARDYAAKGVKLIGISPNDPVKYPEDSLEKMKQRAEEKNYAFVYAIDETQETARAYNAVCTPDPFVYENVKGSFLLRYHGRMDDNWKEPSLVTRHELAEALDQVLAGKEVDPEQKPSMGCSIKWKS